MSCNVITSKSFCNFSQAEEEDGEKITLDLSATALQKNPPKMLRNHENVLRNVTLK